MFLCSPRSKPFRFTEGTAAEIPVHLHLLHWQVIWRRAKWRFQLERYEILTPPEGNQEESTFCIIIIIILEMGIPQITTDNHTLLPHTSNTSQCHTKKNRFLLLRCKKQITTKATIVASSLLSNMLQRTSGWTNDDWSPTGRFVSKMCQWQSTPS